MKTARGFVLALMPVALFGGAASAGTLIVNCDVVSGPTELSAASINCAQYNLADPLLSIEITVSGGITGSITLQNLSSSTQSGSGTVTSDLNVGALSGFTLVNPVFQASFSTGTRTLAAGQTLTVAGLVGTGSASLGTDTTVFGPYSGAGTFAIPVSTSTLFSAGGTGGFFGASQSTNANATARVTYTYGVVPLPTAAWLFGSALGLLRLASRKRTAAA